MLEIDLNQTEAALNDGATVIDVREADEYAEGHVPGVVHVPMAQLPARATDWDKREPVYVICASGNRSSSMADLLTSAGFQAFSVAGGTKAWEQSGRAIEKG